MVARINSKSLRCSDEFIQCVERAQGDTFSDKLDFIVIDYYKSMDKRNDKIKDLDKKIKQREQELEKLQAEVLKVEAIINTLGDLSKTVIRAKLDIFDKVEKIKIGMETIQN